MNGDSVEGVCVNHLSISESLRTVCLRVCVKTELSVTAAGLKNIS